MEGIQPAFLSGVLSVGNGEVRLSNKEAILCIFPKPPPIKIFLRAFPAVPVRGAGTSKNNSVGHGSTNQSLLPAEPEHHNLGLEGA